MESQSYWEVQHQDSETSLTVRGTDIHLWNVGSWREAEMKHKGWRDVTDMDLKEREIPSLTQDKGNWEDEETRRNELEKQSDVQVPWKEMETNYEWVKNEEKDQWERLQCTKTTIWLLQTTRTHRGWGGVWVGWLGGGMAGRNPCDYPTHQLLLSGWLFLRTKMHSHNQCLSI